MILFLAHPIVVTAFSTSLEEDEGDMIFILPALFCINEKARFSLCIALANISIEFTFIKDANYLYKE